MHVPLKEKNEEKKFQMQLTKLCYLQADQIRLFLGGDPVAVGTMFVTMIAMMYPTT